jgi:ribose transport system substrate-binding protein
VAILVAALIAGCGSSSSSSSGSGSSSTKSSTPKANVAAAQADMAPYLGKASAFPVDSPLTKHLPAGATLSYLQCSAVTCALAGKAVQAAAKVLGLNYQAVPAGASVTAETSAMDSIIASKPKIVILPGLNASPLCSQIKQLTSSGAGVGTFGMVGAEQCGVKAAINGETSAELGGSLMADWVVVTKGANANVALYDTPELAFSPYVERGFTTQLAKLCPSCTVRDVDLSLTTYGSTAPSTVVSDLQSHPSSNVAVFVSEEAAIGLPAALRTASLTHVSTIGWGPEPANLEDIKSGGITAGIGVDIPTMIWTTVDAALRVATGQPLTSGEQLGVPPTQVLEQKDITFNPANGFAPYPDFAQRFIKIWTGH